MPPARLGRILRPASNPFLTHTPTHLEHDPSPLAESVRLMQEHEAEPRTTTCGELLELLTSNK